MRSGRLCAIGMLEDKKSIDVMPGPRKLSIYRDFTHSEPRWTSHRSVHYNSFMYTLSCVNSGIVLPMKFFISLLHWLIMHLPLLWVQHTVSCPCHQPCFLFNLILFRSEEKLTPALVSMCFNMLVPYHTLHIISRTLQ